MKKTSAGTSSAAKALLRALLGAGAGAGVAGLENKYLFEPAGMSPELRKINLIIGAGQGAYAGQGAHKALGAFSSWPFKQLGLLGINEYQKDISQRLPISIKQHEAAIANLATARTHERIAKDPKTRTALLLGALGLAAVPATLGAVEFAKSRRAKKDEERRRKGALRVTLPTVSPGDKETAVELPMDVLPRSTYTSLMRDTRRRLRSEAEERKHRKSRDTMFLYNGGMSDVKLSFYRGFLEGMAEHGVLPSEMMDKASGVFQTYAEAPVEVAKETAKKLVDFLATAGKTVLIGGPIAAGILTGKVHADLTGPGEDDITTMRDAEMVNSYRRAADRLRKETEYERRLRNKQRPGLPVAARA